MYVSFDTDLLWVSDLAWRPGGGWIIPDPATGRIHLYDEHGKELDQLIRPGRGPLDFSKPIAVARLEGALLLHNDSTHWLWLDEKTLKPHRQLDMAQHLTANKEKIGSPFSWDVTRQGRVFASVHLYQSDGTWWTGLGSFDLSDPSLFHRILEVDTGRTSALFHTLGLRTVATSHGKGYFLQFEQPVHILEAPGSRRLEQSIPEHLRQRPEIPELRPETLGLVYQVLELSPLAEGLYGHNGHLFLLERIPAENGARWRLHEIDPAADRITRSLDLPTRAHWIELAAGPDHWAILEKGPVRGILDQEHHGLTLVPTPWIEGDPSPLEAPSEVECRRPESGQSPPRRNDDSPESLPAPTP